MHKQLSHILQQEFGVTEEAFREAQDIRAEQNTSLTEILLKKQIVTENQLLEAYSKLFNIPFVPKILLEDFNTEFTRRISIQFLKKYALIPIETSQNILGIANQSFGNDGSNGSSPRPIIAIINLLD